MASETGLLVVVAKGTSVASVSLSQSIKTPLGRGVAGLGGELMGEMFVTLVCESISVGIKKVASVVSAKLSALPPQADNKLLESELAGTE